MGNQIDRVAPRNTFQTVEQKRELNIRLKTIVSKYEFIEVDKEDVVRYAGTSHNTRELSGVFTKQYSPSLPVYVSVIGFGACEAIYSGTFTSSKYRTLNPVKCFLLMKVKPYSDTYTQTYYVVPQSLIINQTVFNIIKPMKYVVKRYYENNDGAGMFIVDPLQTSKGNHEGLEMTVDQFMENVDSDRKGTKGWKLAFSALIENPEYQQKFDRTYVTYKSSKISINKKSFQKGIGASLDDIVNNNIVNLNNNLIKDIEDSDIPYPIKSDDQSLLNIGNVYENSSSSNSIGSNYSIDQLHQKISNLK